MDVRQIVNTRDLSYLLAPAIQKLEMIQRRIEEAKRAAEPKPLERLRQQWDNQHGQGAADALEAQGRAEAGEER